MEKGFVGYVARNILKVAVFLFLFYASNFGVARADDSLPKLTYFLWAGLSYDDDKISGSSALASASIGIDWFRLPNDLATFNTYVGYSHRSRTENWQYFDANGPLIGMEFHGKYLTIGADYFKQNLPVQPLPTSQCGSPAFCSGIYSERLQYYATSFIQWDLSKNPGGSYLGLPGSIWVNETYDDDRYNDPNSQGASTMGFVNQGIDWILFENGFLMNTFVEYRWRSKLVNNEYYDSNGPAIGIDFGRSFYHIGVDYYWQWFPSWPPTPTGSNRLQLYLTIYITNS